MIRFLPPWTADGAMSGAGNNRRDESDPRSPRGERQSTERAKVL
jgi:hypothetical protein